MTLCSSRSSTLKRRWPLYIALGTLLSWLLQAFLFSRAGRFKSVACMGLFGAYLLLLLLLRVRKVPLKEYAVPLILGAGFLMQLAFIIRMPYDFSWHDLGGFGALEDTQIYGGHMGYINYLVKFGRLPMENPLVKAYEDFYHPPLYHLIQAGFLKINLLAGIPLEAALEHLQITTMFFSSLSLWLAWQILEELGCSYRGVRAGVLFAAFQPMFIIYAGTLNNDITSLFFLLLTVLYTLRWLKEPTLRRVIFIALALGLGMAAKFSVVVMALPLGLVFAVRLFQNLREWKTYVPQYLLFLLISVPVGIAWQLFHAIRFGMPLSFVRLPAESVNVGHLPLAARYGIPDGAALRSLFYTGIRKLDYNIWFQTLKTALFDEMTLFPTGSPMWYLSYLLTSLFALLAATAAALFAHVSVKRDPVSPPLGRLFLAVFAVSLLGSYLLFSLQYPYICSFNFRYIFPVVVLAATAFAKFCQKPAWPVKLVEAFIWVFSGLSCVVYGVYLFTQVSP